MQVTLVLQYWQGQKVENPTSNSKALEIIGNTIERVRYTDHMPANGDHNEAKQQSEAYSEEIDKHRN